MGYNDCMFPEHLTKEEIEVIVSLYDRRTSSRGANIFALRRKSKSTFHMGRGMGILYPSDLLNALEKRGIIDVHRVDKRIWLTRLGNKYGRMFSSLIKL